MKWTEPAAERQLTPKARLLLAAVIVAVFVAWIAAGQVGRAGSRAAWPQSVCVDHGGVRWVALLGDGSKAVRCRDGHIAS